MDLYILSNVIRLVGSEAARWDNDGVDSFIHSGWLCRNDTRNEEADWYKISAHLVEPFPL